MLGRYLVEVGFTVYSSDGRKVGTVKSCTAAYCDVEADLLFVGQHHYYIPLNTMRAVRGTDVYLCVPSDRIDEMGWDREPVGRPAAAPSSPSEADQDRGGQ